MSSALLLYDLTSLIRSPLRTGIQHVSFEVLHHWSGPPLLPCRVVSPSELHLPGPEVVSALNDFFLETGKTAENARQWLLRVDRTSGRILRLDDPGHQHAILNTELFYCPERIAFYHTLLERMPERVFFLVYDFLPWLHPDWFPPASGQETHGYLQLIRSARQVSFISEATRRDYRQRILRDPARPVGPALALGSDTLGILPPLKTPPGRGFAMIGTLELRKNHAAVLEAFTSLWADGVDVQLTLIGRKGWPEEMGEGVEVLQKSEPRLRWLHNQSDVQVREVIRASRATIFPTVPGGEGYGLPPLESLSLGVPVIVSGDVPSLAGLPDHGQIRLAVPDAASIRAAVLDMLDDSIHQRKCAAIARLALPRWSDLARQMAEWVTGELTWRATA